MAVMRSICHKPQPNRKFWKSREKPRLFRFSWEQRKLGEVVQITMGQSPDGSTYSDEPSDYVLIQGNADLQNGWVCPRIWTTQITKRADAGDLIMSVRAPAGAMGKTTYDAVIGRGVAAIKGNEFIYQLLVKMDSEGYWKALSCGSTFESLNSDNIKNADVLVPNIAEQQQIGAYFKNLDNLITLHQRTASSIENKNVDGTHPWEQRKFEDIYSFASEGGTPDTNNPLYYNNGTIPFVKIEDTESKYIDSTKSFISEGGLSHSSAWLIPVNSVIFTNGATVGNVAINRLPVATKQGILGIIPTNAVTTEFMFYLLSSAVFQCNVRSRMATGTFATIILKNLNQIPVCVPCSKIEQDEITNYLSALDNLITLHQRERKNRLFGGKNVKQYNFSRPVLQLLCAMDSRLQRRGSPQGDYG